MARPIKQGIDYFPHDCDATNDEKLEALRALYGNDGYAFFFILLERIFRAEKGELSLSIPSIKAALIKKVGVTPEKFEEILSTAFEIKAFNKAAFDDREVLTSQGIQRRFAQIQGQRERWRRNKTKEIFREENTEENTEETPESKVKKSKVKIYTPESQEYILANYLLNNIISNDGSFKQPNMQKWAADMDKLLRIDKRQPTEVKSVIDYAQQDDFWMGNILCPDKLRKQYDQLNIKRKKAKGQIDRLPASTVPLGGELNAINH